MLTSDIEEHAISNAVSLGILGQHNLMVLKAYSDSDAHNTLKHFVKTLTQSNKRGEGAQQLLESRRGNAEQSRMVNNPKKKVILCNVNLPIETEYIVI